MIADLKDNRLGDHRPQARRTSASAFAATPPGAEKSHPAAASTAIGGTMKNMWRMPSYSVTCRTIARPAGTSNNAHNAASWTRDESASSAAATAASATPAARRPARSEPARSAGSATAGRRRDLLAHEERGIAPAETGCQEERFEWPRQRLLLRPRPERAAADERDERRPAAKRPAVPASRRRSNVRATRNRNGERQRRYIRAARVPSTVR